MSSINSKPELQAGNEELLQYRLNLILHHSFCNPQKMLDLIKDYAKNRTSFEWIYKNKYMGDFVIDEIEEIITQSINDVVLSAEINFNLLENPLDSEYKEQILKTPDLSNFEQYSESSNKLSEFKNKIKSSINKNLQNAINSATLSDNLSDRAKEILSSATSGVLSDISGGNVTEIYSKLANIKDSLNNVNNIDYQDLTAIKDVITTIPDRITDSILRK